MRPVILAVFLLPEVVTVGQSPYSIPDTNIFITKTTDFISLHAYAEVVNLTTDTLLIRWKCHFSTDLPAAWDISFDDQETYFPQLNSGDSSDIVLDTSGAFPRKLIIGIVHNGQVGTGTVTLTAFPLANRADSAHIHYIVTVTQGTSSVQLVSMIPVIAIQNERLSVRSNTLIESLTIWDALGKLVLRDEPRSYMADYNWGRLDRVLFVRVNNFAVRVLNLDSLD